MVSPRSFMVSAQTSFRGLDSLLRLLTLIHSSTHLHTVTKTCWESNTTSHHSANHMTNTLSSDWRTHSFSSIDKLTVVGSYLRHIHIQSSGLFEDKRNTLHVSFPFCLTDFIQSEHQSVIGDV